MDPFAFNPTQFIGMSGIPVIEQLIQYLKSQWGLPTYLAPLAALAVGVGLNVGIAGYLHQNVADAIYIGLTTGFLTSFWHEIAKKPSMPSQ